MADVSEPQFPYAEVGHFNKTLEKLIEFCNTEKPR